MYIRKVAIENVRAIEHLEMEFPEGEEAGWHVLIGDNGAGKSTIIKAVALACMGPDEAKALRLPWNEWVKAGSSRAKVRLDMIKDKEDAHKTRKRAHPDSRFPCIIKIEKKEKHYILSAEIEGDRDPAYYAWGTGEGWFSCAYGPFRRFSGGNKDWDRVYVSNPKAGGFLSVFGEDVALTEALRWLEELNYKRLENKDEGMLLEPIIQFLNASGLLPHGVELLEVSSDGVFFKDSYGLRQNVLTLSDGFRSVLSMTFDIIRQFCVAFGHEKVKNALQQRQGINLPGVILIDEIDAHLHPTWQTRVGQDLCRLFPKIQFIVTTHSPLVCRAAEKGSIWRLPQPGTNARAEKLQGQAKDALVYGDVLNAYETEAFGADISMGEEGRRAQRQYRELMYKKDYNLPLTAEEEIEFRHLQQIFHTNVAIDE